MNAEIKHIVLFSGGICSWATAKRVVERHGSQNLTLLFADTMMEDEDLYRFLAEAADNVGAPLVRIADGRTPWQVMEDERCLGNHRIDPCSKILKRNLLDKWLKENCDPTCSVQHFGFDWTEQHRLERLRARKAPWRVEGYMTEPPLIDRPAMLGLLAREGIKAPRLYTLGFHHNNCGGFCIKSGQAQFALLLRTMPERYKWHEDQEQQLRDLVGWRQTILRSRVGGTSTPLSLRELREHIEAQKTFDEADWGGCGCAVDYEESDEVNGKSTAGSVLNMR